MMTETIGNPLSWTAQELRAAARHVGTAAEHVGHGDADALAVPRIRRLSVEDLGAALREGVADFAACRTDVVFLTMLYPIIGLLLAWFAMQREFLPLVFPLMSGFALLGPVAAVGLYEMSRRRERGEAPGWGDAFAVAKSPSFGAILMLGLLLFTLFVLWIMTAHGIYMATLGPETPASVGAFLRDTFTTGAGWAMMIVGVAVGALFAVIVLACSAISFPLLLDRDVGLPVAVVTSMRVFAENPVPMAVWGPIVAGLLVAGSIPFLLGLIVVVPILGHATWHLYRRAVVPEAGNGAQWTRPAGEVAH
jgi:uncharacterized membrane protein